MSHTLAARVLIMAVDNSISIGEAMAWVLRKLPNSLKKYYTFTLVYIVALELKGGNTCK